MRIIDTVQADQIEDGDRIVWEDEEFEVLEVVSEGASTVTLKLHSMDSGDVDLYRISFDETVKILGV